MPNRAIADVRRFWEEAACGEQLYLPSVDREGFEAQAASRYDLEPYIPRFAAFGEWQGKRVLEIGVGLGADHQRFVEAGARAVGIDLTLRATQLTRIRLREFGLRALLCVADAEHLPLPSEYCDLVFSWGVIHHSPRPELMVREMRRVLKPGGAARVMIYSKWSLVGLMLWLRYAFLGLRPFTTISEIFARHLESPGTKAYSVKEARQLFSGFADVRVTTVLSHGDLLTSGAGQRHRGRLLDAARRVWPRWFIRRVLRGRGLFMMIHAAKPLP